MPKNVRLTIFTKHWLHQLLYIPHPISELYWSYILPKEWNVSMNGIMQLITIIPMQPRRTNIQRTTHCKRTKYEKQLSKRS